MNRTKLIATGKSFKFSNENLKTINNIKLNYPKERSASAVMPVLWLAQKQHNNWISKEVVESVAVILNLPVMRVYEVVSFYTMYNIQPVGQYHIQVCRTTPCWLRGSDDILKTCLESCDLLTTNQISDDQKFSLVEVECIGACANAPAVQINDEYYENLTSQTIRELLLNLKDGQTDYSKSKIKQQLHEPAEKNLKIEGETHA